MCMVLQRRVNAVSGITTGPQLTGGRAPGACHREQAEIPRCQRCKPNYLKLTFVDQCPDFGVYHMIDLSQAAEASLAILKPAHGPPGVDIQQGKNESCSEHRFYTLSPNNACHYQMVVTRTSSCLPSSLGVRPRCQR